MGVKTLQIYYHDLKELLKEKDFISARTCLRVISPIDLAEAWDHFTPDERTVVFRLCTRQRAIQLFEELDAPHQLELVDSLKKEDAQEFLQELDPSETGRMIRALPPLLMRRLGGIMKKGGLESVQQYLDYPPKTVGALMRGRYFTLEPGWTAHQAVERLQLSTRLRRIQEIYLDILMVVDALGHLVGSVELKALVVAPRDLTVAELMDASPKALAVEMDQEEAVTLFKKYKLEAAPVVDKDGLLKGVVVYGDVVDIAEEETEEDFAKMAGTAPGMLSHSAFAIAKVRFPWLIATCFGELLVSYIIKHYEFTLNRILALATFIPLIAAMGGNVGSQTATVVVRGLATGEISDGGEVQVILKEVKVGVMIGVVYGILIGAAAEAFYGGRYGWKFSAVVGLGMLVSMTAAATAGSIEPLIFRRMGIDPATATGPLITTFTDILSTSVYFGMATYLLM